MKVPSQRESAAERFLRDYRRMTSLIARREIALRLRANIETQVRPPPPESVTRLANRPLPSTNACRRDGSGAAHGAGA